jgi:four helix bundle protein
VIEPSTCAEKPFDLEQRTARFGEAAIAFAKRVPANLITSPLIPQLVRSAASIGANYCEADDAGSRKEFLYRVSLCKRESREAKHWLRMIVAAEPTLREDAVVLWREAKELNLIFSAIHRRGRSKEKKG